MPTSNFDFYAESKYQSELLRLLAQARAGDRFITANMVTMPHDPAIAKILEAMSAAARRGVKVALITDARREQETPASMRRALARLTAAGVRCVITNPPILPYPNPLFGRSHIKFTVSGDYYFIGGCNLEWPRIDLMVGTRDLRVADWLAELGERLLATGRSLAAVGPRDVAFPVGPGATLFLDSGVRGRSLILEQALDFIDAAREHILITCQLFPGGITGRHLLAAHRRGVQVTIIYNHPSRHAVLHRLYQTVILAGEHLRNPPEFFQHALPRSSEYLHAKLIATEQGAMLGSHNFVSEGVTLGTAELALRVFDPEFGRRASQTVLAQLPQ